MEQRRRGRGILATPGLFAGGLAAGDVYQRQGRGQGLPPRGRKVGDPLGRSGAEADDADPDCAIAAGKALRGSEGALATPCGETRRSPGRVSGSFGRSGCGDGVVTELVEAKGQASIVCNEGR